MCGGCGAIAGDLRYFADRFGVPRASIEGTQLPGDVVREFATVADPEVVYDPEHRRSPLSVRRRVQYRGFELERDVEPLDVFPPSLADRARHALAEALARGEARHPGARENQSAIESVRETYRRSGGATPRLSFADLVAIYERQLARVNSFSEFRRARVTFDADAIVPASVRERYASLPTAASVRGRDVEIHYDVEESPDGVAFGIARLRIPEKVARNLSEAELPSLDRPLRFIVTRGVRGAARASTLQELQEELDRPFTEQEVAELDRADDERRRERHDRRRERHAKHSRKQLDEHRRQGKKRGRRRH